MKKDRKNSADASKLRRRAEAKLRADTAKASQTRTEASTQRIVHELQVHHIELEMQNEELRQSRAELEAILERYTDLYDFAPIGYLTLGRDGAIRRVNLTGAHLLGVERARLLGRRLGVFVDESDRAVFHAFLEKVFASQAQEVCEVVLLNQGKGPLSMHFTATVSQNGQECRVVMMDITERKQAEEALRALSARQEAIMAAVPGIIMEVDCNKVYRWANRFGVEFFGEDVIGKEAFFYFEGEQDTYGTVQPLFNGDDEVFYVESWQRRWDGQKRLLAWWCRVLKDAQSTITGALSTARDITDHNRAEEALRESEERHRKIIEASSDAFLLRSKEIIIYANPAALKLFRANHPEDLIGKPYLDLVHPDDRALTVERVKRAINENWTAPPREHRILALDG
jgi:PAS domain S-box-containing protein